MEQSKPVPGTHTVVVPKVDGAKTSGPNRQQRRRRQRALDKLARRKARARKPS